MTNDTFCFYLKNKLIQTNQTGGQWYSDTSPFSIPRSLYKVQVDKKIKKCSTIGNSNIRINIFDEQWNIL